MELLQLEIAREIRFAQEELLRKRGQVADLMKSQHSMLNEIETLNGQLKQSRNEVQEGKAQLQVRSEATQRLELENGSLRDTVAKLRVQVDASNVEGERLLQRWQLAEGERMNLKAKCEQLEDAAAETAAYKEQCFLMQNQLRELISKIMSQQELVHKEYTRVERAAKDAVDFAKTVSAYYNQQETEVKKLTSACEETEHKMLQLSVAVADARRERDHAINSAKKSAMDDGFNCLAEWEEYEVEMKKRVEGLMDENQLLMDELDLLRNQPAAAAGKAE